MTALYCPSCGTPTWLDRVDNPLAGKLRAKQAGYAIVRNTGKEKWLINQLKRVIPFYPTG
jgi:hypothetical protein